MENGEVGMQNGFFTWIGDAGIVSYLMKCKKQPIGTVAFCTFWVNVLIQIIEYVGMVPILINFYAFPIARGGAGSIAVAVGVATVSIIS